MLQGWVNPKPSFQLATLLWIKKSFFVFILKNFRDRGVGTYSASIGTQSELGFSENKSEKERDVDVDVSDNHVVGLPCSDDHTYIVGLTELFQCKLSYLYIHLSPKTWTFRNFQILNTRSKP
jgi:hypothetical protein